ncbi:MAG TPA: alpha-amylase family glycosyl hydrolase [Candidatus Sulfotelmatobacter sp.]|nr:alpha-amylase family glycosyl hydrolase [Candidatus Sulfotelmatobacter sp.]
MTNRKTSAPLLILSFLLAFSTGIFGQAPIVRKVEPPNWWTRITPELTLLLTGENLRSVQVESPTPGVDVLDFQSSSNGHYAFVHLRLSPELPAGNVALWVVTPSGSVPVQLPVAPRAAVKRRFEGVSQDDVIYLIMPDRFADGDPGNDRPPHSTGKYDRGDPMAYHGGDLRGIRDHLKYLHDLGVTTLWLTPVWKNTDSDYHGYHVVDFYALDDHMGSMQEYQNLVADAHQLGMKVLIDYVANHTGPHHPWADDPPTATWFHGSPSHHLEPAYTFAGIVDPHASAREYRKTLEGWFVNKLPDLNPDDPRLGVYLAQNAIWWTEMAQLDGFRLDTFPYSSREFWSHWHERVRQVYPRINSIGEVADADPTITAFFEGGRKQFDGIDSGLPTLFDFPLENALREVVIAGAPMQKIVDVLQRDDLYPHPEMLVTFFGNHDHSRFISEKGSDSAKLKAAFSLLLTMRGIPQIYSGDEIGMPGGADPDNRRDFPGGFPGDPRDAFTAAGRTPEQQDIFAHVQSLLALRKTHPALRTGKQWHIGWDESYYAFLRELSGEQLLVIYNNAAITRDLKIPLEDTPVEHAHGLQPVFGDASAGIAEHEARVTLAPHSIAVFQVH